MKTRPLLFALAFASCCSASAEWSIKPVTDPMSDQTSYLVATFGDPYSVTEYLREHPALIIELTPVELLTSGGLKYKSETYFALKSDGLRRSGIIATVRFDKNPPEDWPCGTSTDRRAAFFPKDRDPVVRLSSATNLLIRFETTLGAVRTLHFDVSGLKSKLIELKNSLASKYPPGTKFIKTEKAAPPPEPKPPKCAKCGGTGEVVTWKRCRRCYGSGTNGGVPCPKCGTSGRKGYTKQSAPCENCYGRQ